MALALSHFFVSFQIARKLLLLGSIVKYQLGIVKQVNITQVIYGQLGNIRRSRPSNLPQKAIIYD